MSTTADVSPNKNLDLALLLIRLVVGIVFLAHGGQKLFVYGFSGVTGSFGQMNIPMPGITAPLVTVVEFFGGLLLVLGFLTRWAALLIAIDMLGAMFFVHIKGGFFLPSGLEYALTLCVVCIAIAAVGPGAYSIDAKRGAAGTPIA